MQKKRVLIIFNWVAHFKLSLLKPKGNKSTPWTCKFSGDKRTMAAAAARTVGSGVVLPRPVTFVTGNAKKLEEVRAILGQSIPFQSLKLDCESTLIFYFISTIYSNLCLISIFCLKKWTPLCQNFILVPELQGEPEDISKEKARIAAKEVMHPPFIAFV